jgi:heme-degrading monooxygenase HmoA
MAYEILRQFEVPMARRAAFEAAYGPEGPWAALFRRAAGFIAVRLLRAAEGRYITIDRWESEAAFETFRRDFAAEYGELDAKLEGLAEAENPLGAFEAVP